jgi:hypothetical protein
MLPPSVVSALPLIPVAYLTIDGLAVCSFNRDDQAWEVAFIRPDHQFDIVAFHEELTGRIIERQRHGASTLNARLVLEVENGSQEHYNTYPNGAFILPGNFSRLDEDSRDFRWVIDFVGREVPHGHFIRLKGKDEPNRPPVTVAKIPNSLFYTDAVSEAVILAPEGADPSAGTVVGRSNEEIGAVILADPPGTVTISGADEPITLEYEPGHVWRISLTNMDTGKLKDRQAPVDEGIYVAGDFHRYYEVIEVDGTQHYQLWAPGRPAVRGRAGDCHPITATVGSLMSLIT